MLPWRGHRSSHRSSPFAKTSLTVNFILTLDFGFDIEILESFIPATLGSPLHPERHDYPENSPAVRDCVRDQQSPRVAALEQSVERSTQQHADREPKHHDG